MAGAAGRSVRVLLIEDSAEDAQLILRELERGGYAPEHRRVETSAAMKEALDEGPWDVVIADFLVPGFGGIPALRLLRERGLDVPFILASGVIGEEVAVEAMRAGAHDYVMKRNLARLPVAIARELAEAAIRRQRRAAEEALRHQLLFTQALSNSLGEGVLALDASGQVTFTNPAARHILGAAERELEGSHASDIVLSPPGRTASGEGGAVAESAPGELPLQPSDCLFRARDGTLIPVACTVAPLRGPQGPVEGTVVTFQDIRERKRAERAERFLAAASAALAEPIEIGATISRAAALVVPEVAGACAVSVAEDEETIRDVCAIVRDDGGALIADRRRPRDGAGAGQRPLHDISEAQALADVPAALLDVLAVGPEQRALLGRDEPWSGLLVPLPGRGHAVGGIALLSSSRASGEPLDERLVRDYAHRAGLAIENALLHREAQRAIAAREDFLSIASHELRTPLQPLRMQVQALLELVGRGGRDVPPEEHGKQLARMGDGLRLISRQVERLVRLVTDLLDVSRVVAGAIRLDREPVDLAALAREVGDRAEPEAQRARSVITVDAPAPIVGRWDRLRIDQVITNLVANGLKFGAGKPVLLTVRSDGERAVLSVRDQGIGIPVDQLERIFGRFERAVSEREFAGMGLGLFIVRQIVEAHGGRVRVESHVGQGSTFIVELPRG